jgi:hypothetical protein
VTRQVHMPLAKLRFWMPVLVQMTSPRCQHYMFIRRVLGEPTLDALVMSACEDKLMTAEEMRYVAARWGSEDGYQAAVVAIGVTLLLGGILIALLGSLWLLLGVPLGTLGIMFLAEEWSRG